MSNVKGQLSSFMIFTKYSGNYYFLNALTTGQEIIYYFESSFACASGCIGTSLPTFIYSYKDGNYQLKDETNEGGLNYNSQNQLINEIVGVELSINQSIDIYQNWNGILLSDVYYNIQTSNNQELYAPIGESAVINPYQLINLNNVLLVPSQIYFSQNGSCFQFNSPADVVSNFYCVVVQNQNACANITPVSNGWTNTQDCTNGFYYDYCLVNNYCGNSNCYGPCFESYDNCKNLNNNFKCIVDISDYVSSGALFKNKYFIIGISVFFFLLIIAIVVGVIVIKKFFK